MISRLVVLASGSGTTLQALLDELGHQVVAVGADRECAALGRAQAAGVETFVVPFTQYTDRHQWNRAFEAALAAFAPDLVVLAGFMRIFDPQIVRRFAMVNTHPALLPAFPGGHAVRDALAYGVKIAGVTVHRVDAGVDTGPILAQAAVDVRPGDDEPALQARIQAVEKPLYVRTICELIEESS